MRETRIAPALIGAVISLSLAACSRPESVSAVQTAAPPLQAAAPMMSGAEKLQRLNIMLMVTALRCRRTSDDFTSDYRRFTTQQAEPLSRAGAQLRGQFVQRLGTKAGAAAFERLSTSMANNYGQGHPWLGCRQLKQVAKNLVQVQGGATLVAAADQLLAYRGSPRMASAKR